MGDTKPHDHRAAAQGRSAAVMGAVVALGMLAVAVLVAFTLSRLFPGGDLPLAPPAGAEGAEVGIGAPLAPRGG